MKKQLYDASSIQVLKGLDPVRKRPGMYIGDTNDGSGLHHMAFEVIDNAIDEALAGHCTHIEVTLHPDHSMTIADNGRGMPVDWHSEGCSAAELIMTVLHAGSKFNNDMYKVSGGLHGVGVSVVNALSEHLQLTIWRDGFQYEQIYQYGTPQAPLERTSPVKRSGTSVMFRPDRAVFDPYEFQASTLTKRLRELAFLNPCVHLQFNNMLDDTQVVFHYEGGLKAFLNDINPQPLHPKPMVMTASEERVSVDMVCQWGPGYQEHVLCFTNTIPQKDGGTHLSAFRNAVTKTVHRYILETIKKNPPILTGDDVREGLMGIISLKLADPKFSSQTKEKLVSSEVRSVIEGLIQHQMMAFLLENPSDAKLIVQKITQAAKAREAAKKAREAIRKQDNPFFSILPGKIARCQSSDPAQCELFIVEGESAGGSAKQARNRVFQAVLPIRGKVLNVEKSYLEKIFANQELGALLSALFGGTVRDYQFDLLRYHKVVLMTDADVDGAHIRTLLLTFLYRHLRGLISDGHVYIAQPPLYKITMGKHSQYLDDDIALNTFLSHHALSSMNACWSNGDVITMAELHTVSELLIITRQRLRQHYTCHVTWLDGYMQALDTQPSSILLAITLTEGITYHYHDGWWTQTVYGVSYTWQDAAVDTTSYEVVRAMIARGQVTSQNHVFKNIVTCLEAAWLLIKTKCTLQRYKGLGEMNPEQLWETTMDPTQRRFLQMTLLDAEKAEHLFSMLMGGLVQPRRLFIEENASFAMVDEG
jgi:DNA gyrase subunit B